MRNIAFLTLLIVVLFGCATAEVKLVSREFNDQYFTDQQVVDWNIKDGQSKQLLSVCGQTTLLGGYNIFGSTTTASKNYDSGVNHQKLYISFEIYAIDAWGKNILGDGDSFIVSLDGIEVYSFEMSKEASKSEILCGVHGAQDRIQSVSIAVPHYRNKFTLKLSSTLDEEAYESWGIRNLEIVAEYDTQAVIVISEEFMSSNFVSSLDGWDIQGVEEGEEFTECEDTMLFGGYESFGAETNLSKTYNNLPDHYGVIVNFDLWLIDTPDEEDWVEIIIDGQIYYIQRPDYEHFDDNDICGDSDFSERLIPVGIFVPHRNPYFTLTIKGIFDEESDNESFGIQNLRILVASCTSNTCTGVSEEFISPMFSKLADWKNSNGELFSQTYLNNVCAPGSDVFFGPHNSEISKTYTGLIQHTGAKLFFQVLTSGTWDQDTVLLVLVDNAWINPIVAESFTVEQHCSSEQETLRNYFIDVPHTSSKLNLRFVLNNPQSDTSYFIRDLFVSTYQGGYTNEISNEQYNSDSFDKRTWSVSGDGEIQRYSCDNLGIFGLKNGEGEQGKEESITKTFASLPDHTFVHIFLQVFIIDLENEQKITVELDGQIVSVPLIASSESGQRQICGNNAKEQGYLIEIHHPHTAKSLTVSLIHKLIPNQAKILWGFDNFYFSVGDFKLPLPTTTVAAPTASQTNSNPSISASVDRSQCIEIFSECNYLGSSLPICGEASDFQSLGWNLPIKSIRIPEGKSITEFEDDSFDGDSTKISTSQKCLDGEGYFLVKKDKKKRVSKFISQKLKLQKNKGK